MSIEPIVTFVIVNWNQKQLTLDCLASLHRQEYSNYALVMVDNGSTDGSVSAVRDACPGVTVLENSSNLGIAAANNIGINHALASGTDYIFLLNNDTIVDPKMLTHLVIAAESNTKVGSTGPAMLYFDAPERIWCAGNSIDWVAGATKRLRDGLHVSSLDGMPWQDVDFITSCAVCIKRSVFDEVGLMDERYFIYYDETDWFARAAAAGWRALFVPEARMWHKVSATMGTASPSTDYYMIRNRFLFLARNLRGWRRLMALATASLETSRTILAYSVKNHRGTRLRNRNAKFLGMRDAIAGRWGPMGPDVASSCR